MAIQYLTGLHLSASITCIPPPSLCHNCSGRRQRKEQNSRVIPLIRRTGEETRVDTCSKIHRCNGDQPRPIEISSLFAGLSKRPLCKACEHTQAHVNQPPPAPPPLMVSTYGRPHQVATHQHYCPNSCRRYDAGWDRKKSGQWASQCRALSAHATESMRRSTRRVNCCWLWAWANTPRRWRNV